MFQIPPRYHWGFADISDAVGFLAYLGALPSPSWHWTRARNQAHEKCEPSSASANQCGERKLGDASQLMQMFVDNQAWLQLPSRSELAGMSILIMKRNPLIGIADGERNQTGTQQTFEQQDRQVELGLGGGPLQFVHKVGEP